MKRALQEKKKVFKAVVPGCSSLPSLSLWAFSLSARAHQPILFVLASPISCFLVCFVISFNMDVQEHLPPPPPLHRPQDNPHLAHYANSHLVQEQPKTTCLPPLASLPHPTPLATSPDKSSGTSQQATTTGNSSMISSSTQNKIPACVFEKRKSSPAILGVPLGLDDEAQAKLSLHLSRHRNSIEAAMLLANLNRQPATPASEEVVSKQMADDHGNLCA